MSNQTTYTTEEAAVYLEARHGRSFSPQLLRVYCRQERFPHATYFGRQWCIPQADLDAFVPPVMGRPREKETVNV